MGKYVSATPHYLGQFPALALAVHGRHFKEGPVVAARQAGEEELFAGRDVFGQSIAEGGHDTKRLGENVVTPPELLAIGKVTMGFSGGQAVEEDVSRFRDEEQRTLTAATGELVWNHGERFVELRTPKTQGVVGFAGGRRLILPDTVIELETGFASLLCTALDDQPLAASKRILITAMARDKQSGAVFNEDWSRLEQAGAPPLLMEPVQATLRFRGTRPVRVRPCDVYGVPKAAELEVGENGTFTIDGSFQAYYYLVER